MPHMGTQEIGEQNPLSTTSAMQFPPELAAFQAFYRSGTAPMPPPNPYMWGPQPMMPPYGMPPFTSIYPQGGMYAHTSMSVGNHPYSAYGSAAGNMRDVQQALVPDDAEGKLKYGNAKSPSKTLNGSLRPYGKGEDAQKLDPLATINEYGSYSADSGSDGSIEGSAERFLSVSAAPNRDSHDVHLLPRMRGHIQDRVAGELCVKDERDLKRQKRKQSNRESARRSRLRKQTECEELTTRVEALSQENTCLRSKLNQVTKEYKMLSKENCSLLDQLQYASMEENTKFSCQEIVEGNMKLPKESFQKEAKPIV